MTTIQPIILDDFVYTTIDNAFDDISRVLYIDSIPYDDDFFMSIFITDNNDVSVQFEHMDSDNNLDIDITLILNYTATVDFIESNRIDYIERQLDVTMYQKKLYIGDFINDIMIEESYKSDDIQILTKVLKTLNTDIAKARVESTIQNLKWSIIP